MTIALAQMHRPAHERAALRSRLDLPRLLEGASQSFPNRPALADAPNRSALSGNAPVSLTLGELRRDAERIAGLFSQFRLAPGATVAILLPNVPEAALALLGVLRAGLCPLMLPLTLSSSSIAGAIEEARCEAVITITEAAGMRPADTIQEIAATYFGLRFITVFGDEVPDGMIGLDRLPWSLTEAAGPLDRDLGPDYGLIATHDEATGLAYGRSCESLIATGLGVVAAARMKPGQRIISLLPPDDLASLAAGFVPSLAAGIPLTACGLFDSAVLRTLLDENQPTQLLCPAWLEPALAASSLGRHPALVGLLFVHKLPYATGTVQEASDRISAPIVDLLAVGEHALFISPRVPEGPARFVIDAVAPRLPSGHALVEARVEDGMLELRGRAARSRVLPRMGQREPDYATPPDLWSPVPVGAELDGDVIVRLDRLQRSS